MHEQPSISEDVFLQFVFDNADFNVATIDGLITFHLMGGIKCITPHWLVAKDVLIPRHQKEVPASVIARFGHIPIVTYSNQTSKTLKNFFFFELR